MTLWEQKPHKASVEAFEKKKKGLNYLSIFTAVLFIWLLFHIKDWFTLTGHLSVRARTHCTAQRIVTSAPVLFLNAQIIKWSLPSARTILIMKCHFVNMSKQWSGTRCNNVWQTARVILKETKSHGGWATGTTQAAQQHQTTCNINVLSKHFCPYCKSFLLIL